MEKYTYLNLETFISMWLASHKWISIGVFSQIMVMLFFGALLEHRSHGWVRCFLISWNLEWYMCLDFLELFCIFFGKIYSRHLNFLHIKYLPDQLFLPSMLRAEVASFCMQSWYSHFSHIQARTHVYHGYWLLQGV